MLEASSEQRRSGRPRQKIRVLGRSEENGLPDTKDGFPALKGKEENLGWFCKCPYGTAGKTTRSCTFIKSLEGYKCGDKSTPDSQLAYKNNEILGKCGD